MSSVEIFLDISQICQFQALFEKYLENEAAFQKKRYEVLTRRIQESKGSEAAKKVLFKLLDLQQNMNIPMEQYENETVQIMQQQPISVQEEATKIWNEIHPDVIN